MNRAVNFTVEYCENSITVSSDMTTLDFECDLILEKIGDGAEEDEWSVNQWDQDIPIDDFKVDDSACAHVKCSNPQKRRISGKRFEHYVCLTAPNGEKLAVGTKDIELKISYKKPIVQGGNYTVIKTLPHMDLHLFRFDPFRVFNPCKILRYKVVDHSELEVIAHLPNKRNEPPGATVFAERDLQPDETYSVTIVMAQAGLTKKLAGKLLRGIIKLAFQIAKTTGG